MTRLLLASTGGHLGELVLLAPRLSPRVEDELWLTFDCQQSRTLLAGRRVQFIRDTPPRDWRGVLINARFARRLFASLDVEMVVSNGAGVALAFLPLAAARGIPAHYIECAARTTGPSLTGRVLERCPAIQLYTQHPELACDRWRFAGSAFESYQAVELSTPPPLRMVVVTTGTLDFSFRRLYDRLRSVLPRRVRVIVQAGRDGERLDWPGASVSATLPPDALSALMCDADIVVAHAGIGSALMAFEAGKSPILVPRRKSHGEHVDDHQEQIAQKFSQAGLAVAAEASAVGPEHFSRALARRVERTRDEHSFALR